MTCPMNSLTSTWSMTVANKNALIIWAVPVDGEPYRAAA
jgi:hypothetical protein